MVDGQLAMLRFMTTHHPPTWRWNRLPWAERRRRIGAVAGGVHSSLFPSPRSVKLPLGATIHYRGGPEGDVVVRARGWDWVFPAHVAVLDVVYTINGRPTPKDPS